MSTQLQAEYQSGVLTDTQLLTLCKQYGNNAKYWRQKFIGLLPEVEQRQLYLKEGFTSIFEFAAKLSGVSREQVLLTFRLEKKFQSTPQLHQALISGQVPIHQLAGVASVATPENQVFWLNQTKVLSKGALETLVKDTKSQVRPMPRHASNPNKTEKILQYNDLGLSPQIHRRLLSLRNKGIDLNQLLEELLNQREENIQQQKQQIVKEMRETEFRKMEASNRNEQSGRKTKNNTPSRYIPAKIKHLLKEENGDKRAHETCTNKASTVHHTRRYSLSPNHNPLFLAPLCKYHHEIAHAVDVRVVGYKLRQ